jgi:hypothetical protein
MGLKSFFDNIIPNELKGSLGTVAAVAGAAYLGYNYAKDFVGTAGSDAYWGKGGKGNITEPSGMLGFIDKHKDTTSMKFIMGTGKQLAGKAMEGESDADAKARYAAERARMEASIRNKAYNIPRVGQPLGVGSFSVSQARVPGFNNSRVNESLNLMSYFMQDLNDNGRIDSSALHAEGSRGTTIRTASAKNLQIGLS